MNKYRNILIVTSALIGALVPFFFSYQGPTTPYWIATLSILVGLRLIASDRLEKDAANWAIFIANLVFGIDVVFRLNGYNELVYIVLIWMFLFGFWALSEHTGPIGDTLELEWTVDDGIYAGLTSALFVGSFAYANVHPSKYDAYWVIALGIASVLMRITYLLIYRSYNAGKDANHEIKRALICLFVPAWLFAPMVFEMTKLLSSAYVGWVLIGIVLTGGLVAIYRKSIFTPYPDYSHEMEDE